MAGQCQNLVKARDFSTQPGCFSRQRILVTGAAGRIGTLVSSYLANQFSLVLSDRRPLPKDIGLPFARCELTDQDTLIDCCHGIDVVLHLGAISEPTAGWQEILPGNIIGVHNLFQSACEAGCSRVIYASSMMTVDAYPKDITVETTMPVKPSTLYGVSKVWGETLGNYYAEQRGLSVICLRLGWVVRRRDYRLVPGNSSLGFALTEGDLLRLLTAALLAPAEIKYGIFHGISNNKWKRLSIENTCRMLGYSPHDDAYQLARTNYGAIFWHKIKRLRHILRRYFSRNTG